VKKELAPPPQAASDEIVPAMGGTYWDREAPHLPPSVAVGAHVDKGQPLYIVEVMKMFNKVYAPFAGRVVEIFVRDKRRHRAQRPAAVPHRAGREGGQRRSRRADAPHSGEHGRIPGHRARLFSSEMVSTLEAGDLKLHGAAHLAGQRDARGGIVTEPILAPRCTDSR
jgi:Biotin-requiring enzyme